MQPNSSHLLDALCIIMVSNDPQEGELTDLVLESLILTFDSLLSMSAFLPGRRPTRPCCRTASTADQVYPPDLKMLIAARGKCDHDSNGVSDVMFVQLAQGRSGVRQIRETAARSSRLSRELEVRGERTWIAPRLESSHLWLHWRSFPWAAPMIAGAEVVVSAVALSFARDGSKPNVNQTSPFA